MEHGRLSESDLGYPNYARDLADGFASAVWPFQGEKEVTNVINSIRISSYGR